ncbi:NACHT domain-containing protein [Streptomyces sp. RLB3-17]|uniref:NACHT domain-containing protein n=1 Tax=Streptomyces sp. RLB3-17 TaxID=2594455 RepID=UPI001966D38B|nr:NACHT domain-containing protein [Streptomyces sp. RLB3-17]
MTIQAKTAPFQYVGDVGTRYDDGRGELETVLAVVLRKQQPPEELVRALTGVRRFSLMKDALDGVPEVQDGTDARRACKAIRTALYRQLPDRHGELAELLGLDIHQSKVLRCVLAGMTIADAVRQLGDGEDARDGSTGSRWMSEATVRIASWVMAEEGRPGADVEDKGLRDYLEQLADHCAELPNWFPQVPFTTLLQEVTVTPPAASGESESETSYQQATELRWLDKSDTAGMPRRVPWTSALDQYRRVLLVGGPGSGKSWAVRGRALTLAQERLEGQSDGRIPILITAPKLESTLGEGMPRVGDRSELAKALAESLPPDVAWAPGAVPTVLRLLEEQAAVELLVDGYDEVRNQQPRLAQRLGEIVSLLNPKHSRFVLTTRPSAIPQHRFAKYAAFCELQPFGTPEQLHFVGAWFTDRPEPARRVRRWVIERRLELLRSPLLLALLCKVSDTPDAAPPRTERELWELALDRLTRGEGRDEELTANDERVRLRKQLMEEIASLFQSDTGLLAEVPITDIERQFASDPAWQELRQLTSCASVIDDLVATGVVRKVKWKHHHALAFLHDAIRDHLLAKLLARHNSWSDEIWRIWSQPEWEQVIGATGAFLDDPDKLVRELEIRFPDDPLNAARFTAGLVLAAGGAVSADKRESIRDELLILLCSDDAIDRSRSAMLLSSLQDQQTAGLVRNLLHPSLPSHVIAAAMRTIASGSSAESLQALIDCARRDDFTPDEREAAVEALAETGANGALTALELLAADVQMLPVVRAAAAAHALRSFDSDMAMRHLLEGTEEDSRTSRRALTERLLGTDVARPLSGELVAGTLHVTDPYCAALLLTAGPGTVERGEQALVQGLPKSAAVDALSDAVERVRAVARHDPLLIVLARYILDADRRPDLRWRLAREINDGETMTVVGVWESFARPLSHNDVMGVGQFLVEEADRLPKEFGDRLRSAIAQGVFGPLVQVLGEPDGAFGPAPETVRQVDTRAAKDQPNPNMSDQGAESAAMPTIAEVLDSDHESVVQYQLLRALRRAIPADGDDRIRAAALTNVVAVGTVTTWIDVQPRVAPLAESRLVAIRHQLTDIELARLRARWPERQEEVVHTQATFSAKLLDARAEAALLSNDLDEAATMALASIGARQAEGLRPTSDAVSVLFAAGGASGRTWSTHRQVDSYLKSLPAGSRVVLSAWLSAANKDYTHVAQLLDMLPAYMRSSADVAGLRIAAGLASDEAFEQVMSWSGCMRVVVLLQAVRQFDASPTLTERLEHARAVAARRANALFTSWPPVMLDSPSLQGTPKWSWVLADIAATQLKRGRADVAAAVYEAAVAESPDNARFINNLGFCQIPLDRDLALRTLDRAAELFAVPFAVNVANRMLLRLLRGDAEFALDIGDDYYRRGTPTNPGSWLWDMDDVSILDEDVDEQNYILELGRRAAVSLGRYGLAEEWERRLRSRRPSGGKSPEASDE